MFIKQHVLNNGLTFVQNFLLNLGAIYEILFQEGCKMQKGILKEGETRADNHFPTFIFLPLL